MDLFATILEHTDFRDGADTTPLPSRSLLPLFNGDAPVNWGDDAVFSEQEETRVVRTQKWAYFKRFQNADGPDIGDELYDVEHDPQETTNLAGSETVAAVEKELTTMLTAFFDQHVRPEADLWEGGVPIQNSMRKKFWRSAWGDEWNPVYHYDSK